MSNIFLVTSAINTVHGQLSPEQRLQQTLETVSSIRQRVTDSRIALLEIGPQALNSDQQSRLGEMCDLLVPLSNESMVRSMYDCSDNTDFWIKTPCEIWAMAWAMHQTNLIQDRDRVFKISGRYQLNRRFDIRNHSPAGQMAVKIRMPEVMYYDHSGQIQPRFTDWQYSTRLYSFCGSMMSVMRKKYTDMFDFVLARYARQEFTDAEHVFFHFCHDLQPRELPWLGIQGYMAPSVEWMSE